MAVSESRQELSESWRGRFEVLDKIDGAIFRRWRELSMDERWRVGFRLVPFAFSVAWYGAKGMWEKGLSILTAFALLATALGAVGVPGGIVWVTMAATCAGWGTSDYYNRVEHGERIWPRLAARMPAWLQTIPALAVVAAVAVCAYAAFLMRS